MNVFTTSHATDVLSPVVEYARLLHENHRLIAAGLGDGKEADALADRMDAPWYAMTEAEQERMGGLSEDLYVLADGGPQRIDMSDDQLARWRNEAREVYERYGLGDADSMLGFLRRSVPSSLPRHIVPFFQARCWEMLGDSETALLFAREARRHEVEPTASSLFILMRLDGGDEVRKYAERILTRSESGPELLYFSAGVLLAVSRSVSGVALAAELPRVSMVLKRAHEMLLHSTTASHTVSPRLDAAIALTRGLCYEQLNLPQEAVIIYTAALQRHPRDGELLTARGLSLYPERLEDAMDDFRNAIRVDAKTIWPWYLLALHAQTERRSGAALQLALHAVDRAGPSPIRAEVYEMIAIAQANLGQNNAWVIDNFTKAHALDPANDRICRNFAVAQTRAEFTRRERRTMFEIPQWDRRRASLNRERELLSSMTDMSDQLTANRQDSLLAA